MTLLRDLTDKDLIGAANDHKPVAGHTHGFYKYPARFSPAFVRAVIRGLTQPGDLVLDPFVGGGTTVVEAFANARYSVGCDINELACFVTKAKTTLLSPSESGTLQGWLSRIDRQLVLTRANLRGIEDDRGERVKNLDARFWRVRRLIALTRKMIDDLPTEATRSLAKTALLLTGQQTLDCKSYVPAVSFFRRKFVENLGAMIRAITDFSQAANSKWQPALDTEPFAPIVVKAPASSMAVTLPRFSSQKPRLILTSPPYPGVHVLYHRWQILGRRETDAPYWITDCRDGEGASFYTFGDRHSKKLDEYFDRTTQSFLGIRKVCDNQTVLVQMMAFSDSKNMLPRYLDAMNQAGFREIRFRWPKSSPDGRLWRQVPNRKWYSYGRQSDSSREVVLFHRPA